MTSAHDHLYSEQFPAGWTTIDLLGHMANTAYLDPAADVRVAFFGEHGLPPAAILRALEQVPRLPNFAEMPSRSGA